MGYSISCLPLRTQSKPMLMFPEFGVLRIACYHQPVDKYL